MNEILGIWRLVYFQIQGHDGQWAHAIDEGAHGHISYWPNGRMQVMMGGASRPRLRGEWSQVPAEQKAQCLDKMVAYAGSYRVVGDRVHHMVDACWIPNWEGRDLVRQMSFPQAGQLLLATPTETGPRGRAAQRVLWERV